MNKKINISREHLKGEIIFAFKDVSYPGDDNITISKDYCKMEFNDPNAHLAGVHWKDLVKESCYSETGRVVLVPTSNLTLNAYHFYLPGYMIVSLEHYDDSCLTVPDFIHSLVLRTAYSQSLNPDIRKIDEKNIERFERLSLPQKHVVKKFLEYMNLEHGDDLEDNFWDYWPSTALKQYWKDF